MSIRFKYISRRASQMLPNTYRHGCHAMLFAPTDIKILNSFDLKKLILMTMRYDGKLGFPWGFSEGNESLEETVTNQLAQVLGVPKGKIVFNEDDYLSSHYSEVRSVCLHFFTKRISPYTFTNIEDKFRPHLQPKILGLVRCPLYVLGDGASGFPAFLNHNFIGNSKECLIEGIRHHNILPGHQINDMLRKDEFADLHSIVE